MKNIFIGGNMDCQSLIYKSALNLKHDNVYTFRKRTQVGSWYGDDSENHKNDTILCIGLEFAYLPTSREAYCRNLAKLEQLTFQQSKETLKMLKYISGYGRILHFIVDPYEKPLSLYFDNAESFSDYSYTKNGIEIGESNLYSGYLRKIATALENNEKKWLLYFGCNEFTSGSTSRKQWIDFVKKIKEGLSDFSDVSIYINSKNDKSNEISQEEYFNQLSHSMFSLVGSANAPGHFSSLRIQECWAVGCIPLVWSKSNYQIFDPDYKGPIFDTVDDLRNILKKGVM